jgi:hypothetical protein
MRNGVTCTTTPEVSVPALAARYWPFALSVS